MDSVGRGQGCRAACSNTPVPRFTAPFRAVGQTRRRLAVDGFVERTIKNSLQVFKSRVGLQEAAFTFAIAADDWELNKELVHLLFLECRFRLPGIWEIRS